MALAYLSVHVECGEVGERVHVLTHSCMVLLIKIMIMSFFEIHTEMRISIAICDHRHEIDWIPAMHIGFLHLTTAFLFKFNWC